MEFRDLDQSIVILREETLFLNITPQAKQSTKFSGHAYTDPKKRKYLTDLIEQIKTQFGNKLKFKGLLRVTLVFISKWRKNRPDLFAEDWSFDASVVDCDNYSKPLTDALQSAEVIENDCKIVILRVGKLKSNHCQIQIKLEQIARRANVCT